MIRVVNTETFIQRAKKRHGDTYDYSKVVYTNSNTAVEVICKKHGSFFQMPTNHYLKSGCPKCAGAGYVRTWEELQEELNHIHNSYYLYDKVVYRTTKCKVVITCPTHGDFVQRLSAHKYGQGCPTCAETDRKLSKEEVIDRFVEAHGDKFDYSKVRYVAKGVKVIIICPVHGEFTQIPRDHWTGNGCQKCSNNGFSSLLPGILYYLSIDEGKAYKIGITNRSIDIRFIPRDLKRINVLQTWELECGQTCRDLENRILKTFRSVKYDGEPLLQNGNTELFYEDIFDGKSHEIDTERKLQDFLDAHV